MRSKNVREERMQTGKKKGTASKRRRTEEEEVSRRLFDEIPTELALGSDGRIYVNAEGVAPEKLAGRKIWRGFALTDEEAAVAREEIHRVAFNVTIGVQTEMHRRATGGPKLIRP